LLAVEVLDEGGEGVEVAASRIPANKHLAGVCAQVEGEHLLLVVHVDLDLLGRLGMGDGIAVADLDLGAVFAAGAEEGANNTFLLGGAAEGVVEDGEDGLFGACQRVKQAASHGGCRIPGAG
jgi:3-dehydroquinate synthase class II